MARSWWGLAGAAFVMVKGNRKNQDDDGSGEMVLALILAGIQGLVFGIILSPLAVLYLFGLYVSGGVSLWRLIEQDFGDAGGANQKPALQILYGLGVAQVVLFGYRTIHALGTRNKLTIFVSESCVVDKGLAEEYLEETVAGCQQDPSFATGRNFVTYGVELILGAKSNKGFIAGIRVLGGAIKDYGTSGCDGRKVLAKHLLARSDSWSHMILRLLETVGPRSPYSREVREHTARIVALVASRIRLDQFPGVIECISSMLDPSSSAEEESNQQRDDRFDRLYQQYNRKKGERTVRTNFSSIIHDYERVEVLETYELDYLVNEIKSPVVGPMEWLVQCLPCKRRTRESKTRRETRSAIGLRWEAMNIINQLAVDGDNRRIMSNTVIPKFAMAPLRLHRGNRHHQNQILGKYWVQWLVAALKWTNSQGQTTLEEEGQPAAAATSGGGERRSGKEVLQEEVEEGWSSKVGSARRNAIDNIKHAIISIFDCLECGATQKKQAIQILLYLSSDMSFIMDTESRRRRLDWILALIYYFPRGNNLEQKWIIGFTDPDAFSTIFRRLAHEKLCSRPGAAETATRLALEDLADALSYNTEDISIRTHAAIILQGVCVGYKPDHGEEVKGILFGVIPKVVNEILIRCASMEEGRHAQAGDVENGVVSEDDALARRISQASDADNKRLLKALVSLSRDGYMKKKQFEA